MGPTSHLTMPPEDDLPDPDTAVEASSDSTKPSTFANFPDRANKKSPQLGDIKDEKLEETWVGDYNFRGKRREPRLFRKRHRYRRVRRDRLDPWEPRGTDNELQDFNQKIFKLQSFDSKAQLVMAKARKLYMDFD